MKDIDYDFFTEEERLLIQKKNFNKNIYVLLYIILFPLYFLSISYFRFTTYSDGFFLRLMIELLNWMFYSLITIRIKSIYKTNKVLFEQIFTMLITQSLFYVVLELIIFSDIFPIISTIGYFVIYLFILFIEFYKFWGLRTFIFLYNYIWFYFLIIYIFSIGFNLFTNQLPLIFNYIIILPTLYFFLTIFFPKINPYKSRLSRFVKIYKDANLSRHKDNFLINEIDSLRPYYRGEILFKAYTGFATLDSNTFKILIPLIVCIIGFIIFVTFGGNPIFNSLLYSVCLLYPLRTSKTVYVFALNYAS